MPNETIRRGKYRDRLLFQLKTKQRDEMGGFTEVWTDDFTVWGHYEIDKSDLDHIADKRFAVIHATFEIPYQPNHLIQATTHRIVIVTDPLANPVTGEDDEQGNPVGQAIWDIYPPLPDDKRRKLVIKARRYQ